MSLSGGGWIWINECKKEQRQSMTVSERHALELLYCGKV